jgi:hypothetical protein
LLKPASNNFCTNLPCSVSSIMLKSPLKLCLKCLSFRAVR